MSAEQARAAMAVAIGWAMWADIAIADEIHVYEGESIQAAIDTAVDGDEIIVHPGTYFEVIDLLGKAIWLRGDAGASETIIHGMGLGSVVTCVSDEEPDTVLEGLTFTGGTGTPSGGNTFGGGLYSNGGSPTVVDCVFTGNEADFGGGCCYYYADSAVLRRSTISANMCTCYGGGVFSMHSNPIIENCVITENAATDDTCGQGGGARVDYGAAFVVNTIFTHNWALEHGGGLFTYQTSMTVANCSFFDNFTDSKGGAIQNWESTSSVINCTFAANTAGYLGGAIGNQKASVTAANCVMWGDAPDEITNFLEGSATVAYSCVEGGYSGEGNIDEDPLFVEADGGDLRLSKNSPCIDAGKNTAVPADLVTDLNGKPRFVDDPATEDTGMGEPPIVDMGAFEFQPCPADVNEDGAVDVADLLIVLAQWGSSGPLGDVNYDGLVDVLDLLALLEAWGPCP